MREYLIENRKKANMSQTTVATKSEISRVYYSQIETGVRNPSVKVAKKIAEVLSFDWKVFFSN